MAVHGRRAAETKYGIVVHYKDGTQTTHWYKDEVKRDKEHGKHSRRGNVLAVQNIEGNK